MGLIKAIAGAAGGVMADQWKEYFYCEAMPANILATKGHKKVTGRSSNYKGDENIITNGSMIAVADGQCMLIVEQGKVVEVCAEPGEFLYDSSTEPSIFSGKLGDGIGDVFRNIGKRFTFGGEAPKDQRVYYFNTKELIGNKYGTASPVPFRVVDQRAAIDIDVGIRCFGEYSYHIANPLLFYTNVCGNVSEDYDRSNLDSQLKTELLTALQPAFAKISEMGIRYSALPGHTVELADALNEALSAKWRDLRVRTGGQHGQILRELRQARPGSRERVDVQLRREEHGQVLLELRQARARERVDLRVRHREQGQILLQLRQAQSLSDPQTITRYDRACRAARQAPADLMTSLKKEKKAWQIR